MPESVSFVGSGFFVESVLQQAPSTIRVRYSYDPEATSSTGAHDGLNPANYVLSGPTAIPILSCGIVAADSQSIDLQLAGPLVSGTWTVTVSNVQTPGGGTLTSPTSGSFATTVISPTTPFNGGAVNDEAFDIIRKHLSPALQGPGVNSLIAALAAGDSTVFANGAAVFDQLFVSSAGGIYLDRKLGDDGIRRPTGIGMSDDVFRNYGIGINAHKLTENAILEVLKIFYGPDAIQAYVTTALTEPFALSDQDQLFFTIDEQNPYAVTFQEADFVLIQQAKAAEVAAAITRAIELQGGNSYALPFIDPVTGLGTVRIYSATIGLRSAVRVTGGRAQSFLQFPARIGTPASSVTPSTISWTVSIPRPNVARFTLASGSVDLTQVVIGDYVNVLGNSFHAQNRGTFPITNVSVTYPGGTLTQYFEVTNSSAYAETVSEALFTDLLFFTPVKQTIQNGLGRTAFVVQATPDSSIVQLPATTIAVSRHKLTGAYLPPTTAIPSPDDTMPLPMVRIGNVVTVTSPGHGLSVGNQIYVDGAYGGTTVPASISGSQGTSGSNGTTDANWVSIVSELRPADVANREFHTATLMNNGQVLITGGLSRDVASMTTATLATSEQFELVSSATLGAGQVQWTYNWIATASLPAAVFRHTATLVPQGDNTGYLLVLGGVNAAASGYSSAAYLYNPGANTWATEGWTLGTARAAHTASVLQNGDILVAGGAVTNFTTTTSACELIAADQSGSSATGSLLEARCEHQAIALQDGRVLAIGGRTLSGGNLNTPASGILLASSELYNTIATSSELALTTASSTTVYTHTVATLGTGVVPGSVVLNDGTTTFTDNGSGSFAGGTSFGASWTGTIVYSTGVITVTFGSQPAAGSMRVTYKSSNAWTYAGNMFMARVGHRATLLNDGRVLVTGGYGYPNQQVGVTHFTTASAEIWDPRANGWTPAGQMASPRAYHMAALLPDGRVMVAGGIVQESSTAVLTFEFFDPTTNTWSTGITSLPQTAGVPAWDNGIAVAMAGGPVLLTGGALNSGANTSMGLLIPGSDVLCAGELDGLFSVASVIDSGHFTYATGQSGYTTNSSVAATITPLGATTWSIPGPFAYDPQSGFGITSVSSNLNQHIYAGQQYGQLTVDDATVFPDSPGYISISFGTSRSVGPIRYLGRYSSTALLIDYSFVFPTDIPPVVDEEPQVVTLLIGPGIYVPANPEAVGSFYLTDSNSGRVAAQTTITSIIGAGLNVVQNVVYPGDRGLGGEGLGATGQKFSDKVLVWGSDDLDADEAAARSGSYDGVAYDG